MYIDKPTNASFNFKAPSGKTENSVNEVLFPDCEVNADVDLSADVPITQMKTMLDLGALDGAKTLNLDINAKVTPGAILHVKVASDATARTLTFGTGITSPALAGTINKTKVMSFMYNGTTFYPMGASLQID